MVQSVCLTSRGSGVRLPLLPPPERANRSKILKSYDFGIFCFMPLPKYGNGSPVKVCVYLQNGNFGANRTLLESLVNNLVVNALRHNRPDGEITVTVSDRQLSVANTSDAPALDSRLIFSRFYRPSEKSRGNGLGLAIVKAVCDYHGWTVSYSYDAGIHRFTVVF